MILDRSYGMDFAFSLTANWRTMLQKLEFEEQVDEPDRSFLLRPTFYWELIQRRWLYAILPFVGIACAGLAIAKFLPAVYLSEGRILVESQQIPTELVRPTVTTAAQERIQVIEQRTMTRDNLVAIAEKFDLFPDRRRFMSVGEVVELMKKSAKIAPIDSQLDFKQGSRNPTIIFSVGFEYPVPQIAAQVANELMTNILNEDLRDRTGRASDTTKFLAREVEKLRADNDALDAKIAQLKLVQARAADYAGVGTPDQPRSLLGQLKSELAQKSALYSDKHPVVRALRQQIAALEQQASSSEKDSPAKVSKDAKDDVALAASLVALTAQRETLQKNLDVATTKLATARVGENLEKNQQSEKLEVIEQPSVPQDPVRPKRTKIAGMSLLLAVAAGVGLALVVEMTDKAIRRGSDVFGVVNRNLVVSIPYIPTQAESNRRKRLTLSIIVGTALLLIGLMIVAVVLLPTDLMFAKMRVGLFR